jgi:hypothetical protein
MPENQADRIFNELYGRKKNYRCRLSNGVYKDFQTEQLAWAYGENWKMHTGGNYFISKI